MPFLGPPPEGVIKVPDLDNTEENCELDSQDGPGEATAEASELVSTSRTSTGVLGAATPRAQSAEGREALPPVQICIRVRPLLDWERAEGHTAQTLELKTGQKGSITLLPRPEECSEDAIPFSKESSKSRVSDVRSFGFHAVVGHESNQQDVWEQARVGEMVARVVQGFHATVFAYGQTGTGKTHTMEGFAYEARGTEGRVRPKTKGTPPERLGIVPRAVEALFKHTAQAAERGSETFMLRVSFLQIYKEQIFDLLNPGSAFATSADKKKQDEAAGLKLRWDTAKGLFVVENLFEYECGSAEEVLQHYAHGAANKHVAMTAMNAQSSRSHTIFLLTVVHRTSLGKERDQATKQPACLREVLSNLALVDLAGSERAAATQETVRERFKEAVNINQSLFSLRRVITALSKRKEGDEEVGHIPYRDSKLTSLLQHAIGGRGFMLMLACLSPSDRHHEENLSTLQYATQAGLIKNDPVVNLDPKDRLIDELQRKLDAAHAYILRQLGLEVLPEDLLQEEAQAAAKGGSRRGTSRSRRRAASARVEDRGAEEGRRRSRGAEDRLPPLAQPSDGGRAAARRPSPVQRRAPQLPPPMPPVPLAAFAAPAPSASQLAAAQLLAQCPPGSLPPLAPPVAVAMPRSASEFDAGLPRTISFGAYAEPHLSRDLNAKRQRGRSSPPKAPRVPPALPRSLSASALPGERYPGVRPEPLPTEPSAPSFAGRIKELSVVAPEMWTEAVMHGQFQECLTDIDSVRDILEMFVVDAGGTRRPLNKNMPPWTTPEVANGLAFPVRIAIVAMGPPKTDSGWRLYSQTRL